MARVVVFGGTLAWDGTGRGGHQMYILQWLESLRTSGWDVLYVDTIHDDAKSIALFEQVVEAWWTMDRASAITAQGFVAAGLQHSDLERFATSADLLITLGAPYAPEPPSSLSVIRPRVLIDQDPGFTHMWADQKPEAVFGRHDFYFTVGGNVGEPGCSVPPCGIRWRHTWNPVVLDWWPVSPAQPERPFTTVASLWSQGYQQIGDQWLGPKAEQLQSFLTLPSLIGEPVAIAAEPGVGELTNQKLVQHGWIVDDALTVAGNPYDYRRYISSAAGEFACAKGVYVVTRSGWFSDRSSCFLTAGRPVVLQDTGFGELLPTGEGLFAVRDVDEAAQAIMNIREDYERHSRAARRLGQDHFAGSRVIAKLMSNIGRSSYA